MFKGWDHPREKEWREIVQGLFTSENESRSERRFGTWFGPFLIWKPDFTLCERKALSNQAFETRKKGVLDRDPRRKPDSRTCERKALLERDSCESITLEMRTDAWVNQRGLRSGNKTLPHSAQILIVIGKAFAMHVNARSVNHDPNHEADEIRNVFRNVIRSFVHLPNPHHHYNHTVILLTFIRALCFRSVVFKENV